MSNGTEKLDRLGEEFFERVFSNEFVEGGIFVRGRENEQIAPLSAKSLVS
jgi:hypothetical protein